MTYKKKDLEKTALKEIKDKRLIFIDDVVCYLPCAKKTFYEHKLHESHAIKDALQLNKTDIKVSLRSKWYNSDNATLQIALMRLTCSTEERKKLAINYIEQDITTTEVKQVYRLDDDTDITFGG